MATTVDVVKGSDDEAILRKQFGDSINYNYTDRNQFVGADREATNKMYQDAIGRAGNDIGSLWDVKGSGISINDGYDASKPISPILQPPAFDPEALLKQMQTSFQQQLDAFNAQTKAQTQAQTNQNNYLTNYKNNLNGTAQGTLNTTPITPVSSTLPQYKNNTGAQIKSNSISRYLAKDMWANK